MDMLKEQAMENRYSDLNEEENIRMECSREDQCRYVAQPKSKL